MIVKPKAPFDFHRTLRFILSPPALLNGRKFTPLLDYFEGDEFRRVAEVDGEPVLYGVSESRSGAQVALQVRIIRGPSNNWAGNWAQSEIRELVRRQLATDLDLGPFYKVAATDRVLSRLAVHFHGMRIPQVPNPYEAIVCAILEQQVNLSFAHQVKKALIETYGRTVDYDGRPYNMFPDAAALALATPRDLLKIQVSGPKAKYIIEISRAVVDGGLDLDKLRQAEPAEAREKLLDLKGVGEWTAHYVAMRSLGHLDCLPAADVGLQKAVQLFYGLRKQPHPRRVEELARRWAGWRSYATFYLWLTYWEERHWRENLRAEVVEEVRGTKRA
jgi:DNA-3-methyladenine glycosylase II